MDKFQVSWLFLEGQVESKHNTTQPPVVCIGGMYISQKVCFWKDGPECSWEIQKDELLCLESEDYIGEKCLETEGKEQRQCCDLEL